MTPRLGSFGEVLGELDLVPYTSLSVFSGLTPSPQTAVHRERVSPLDYKEFSGIRPAVG